MGADAPAGDDTAREATAKPEKKKHFCSFCTKSQDDVKLLIAATNVWICNECIGLCVDKLKDNQVEPFSNSREAKLEFLLGESLKEMGALIAVQQSRLRDEQSSLRSFAEKIAGFRSQLEKLPSPDYKTDMVIFPQER